MCALRVLFYEDGPRYFTSISSLNVLTRVAKIWDNREDIEFGYHDRLDIELRVVRGDIHPVVMKEQWLTPSDVLEHIVTILAMMRRRPRILTIMSHVAMGTSDEDLVAGLLRRILARQMTFMGVAHLALGTSSNAIYPCLEQVCAHIPTTGEYQVIAKSALPVSWLFPNLESLSVVSYGKCWPDDPGDAIASVLIDRTMRPIPNAFPRLVSLKVDNIAARCHPWLRSILGKRSVTRRAWTEAAFLVAGYRACKGSPCVDSFLELVKHITALSSAEQPSIIPAMLCAFGHKDCKTCVSFDFSKRLFFADNDTYHDRDDLKRFKEDRSLDTVPQRPCSRFKDGDKETQAETRKRMEPLIATAWFRSEVDFPSIMEIYNAETKTLKRAYQSLDDDENRANA